MEIPIKENLIKSIGDLEQVAGGIDQENIGLVLQMASRNLYSDPIGSFIRELVANAVDANIDADEKSPVLVHIYSEEDGSYIEVKDNGVGMSPEIYNEIYMKWFSSDKRTSKVKIGGWGIGSKSPLAYQEDMEIITRYNGIQYHRVLANATPLPISTLILEEETDESNGTTIRVAIKEGDEFKVAHACTKQLVYFDNVYVKNELNYYDNNFKIYETEHFKLRNKDFPFNNEMHVCLGQVAYPINWNTLKLERINLPVALKFNIEDLEVTLSREDLNYTEKVKERITKKIKLVEELLLRKYEEQLKITDLKKFILLVDSRSKPPLIIEDVEISMTGIKTNMYFKPLNNLKVVKNHIGLVLNAYEVYNLKGGKLDLVYLPSIRQIFYNLESNYQIKGNFNFYDTMYLNNGTILRRKKLNKKVYRSYAKLLGIKQLEKGYYGNVKTISVEDGSFRKIYTFIKYLDNYLETRLRTYDGIATEEWKEEYREQQRQLNQEKKDKITCYEPYTNKRFTKTIEELLSYKMVFTVNKKTSTMEKTLALFEIHNNFGNEYFKSQTKVIFINPTSITKLNKYKSIKPIETILKVKSLQSVLWKIKMSNIFTKEIKAYSRVFSKSRYYMTIYNQLKIYFNLNVDISNYYNDTRHNFNIAEILHEELDKVVITRETKKAYEEKLNQLKSILDKLEILKYLESYTPNKLISKIILEAKVLKFNEEYYKQ